MPKITLFAAYNNDGEVGEGEGEDGASTAIERYTDNYSGRYRLVKVTIDAPEIPEVDQEAEVKVDEAQAGPVHADPADANDDDEIDPAKEAGA